MRRFRLFAVLLALSSIVASCGWSPPSSPPPATCNPDQGPTGETIANEISRLPGLPQGELWQETARGYTANCQLHWVQVGAANTGPERLQQVLFFDHNTPLGPATPQPRPYISVSSPGQDTVAVQYMWRQGQDAPCCPTGIGTVRFTIQDGKLKALDPIPNP